MSSFRLLAIALLLPLAADCQPPAGKRLPHDPPPAKDKDKPKDKDDPKAPPKKAAPPTINEQIAFGCRANLEKKIGDGESASLAVFALKSFGARPRMTDYPEKGDAVWGSLIYRIDGESKKEMGKFADVLPGDIVQFRDARFPGMTVRCHTAIVRAIDNETARLDVWEQRGRDDKDVVLEGEYPLASMKKGWARIYRPVPR